MTTALDMIPAIGAKISVRFEDLHIDCTVRNVKNSWGKPRLLIVPDSGAGEQWVELSRVVNPQRSTVKVECCPGVGFHSSNCPRVRP